MQSDILLKEEFQLKYSQNKFLCLKNGREEAMDLLVDVLCLRGHRIHYTNYSPSQILNGILMTLQNKLLHHMKICQCHCNTSVRFCILNASQELMCQRLGQQPVQRRRGTETFRRNGVEGNEILRCALNGLLIYLCLLATLPLPLYFYLYLSSFLSPSPLVGISSFPHFLTSRQTAVNRDINRLKSLKTLSPNKSVLLCLFPIFFHNNEKLTKCHTEICQCQKENSLSLINKL